MRAICLTLLSSLVFTSAQASIPELTTEQLRDYTRELQYLEKTFFADQRKGDQFGEHFWRESKRVADHTGPNIIAAILPYATKRKWSGEEGVIFVPLVAMLPRQQTLAILRAYERSPREPEHILGREYLTELEAEDTEEGVLRYSK
jgi:hypothetical protein